MNKKENKELLNNQVEELQECIEYMKLLIKYDEYKELLILNDKIEHALNNINIYANSLKFQKDQILWPFKNIS